MTPFTEKFVWWTNVVCAAVSEKEDKVNAVWQQMNKGVSSEKLNSILNKHKTTVNKTPKKSSSQVSPVLTTSPFFYIDEY